MNLQSNLRNLFTIILLAVTACETERIIFEGPYFVRFDELSEIKKESFSKVINIPVHVAGPAPESNLTIRYSVSGNAREGVDFIILGDKDVVVIPEGEHFGNIQIRLINNANNILRSQDIIFHLENSDNGDIRVGQNPNFATTFTFTILDDCILGGNYLGQENPFQIPVEGITVIGDDACEIYTISNWNLNFFSTPFDVPLTFRDNGDNTLTIPKVIFQDTKGVTIEGLGTVDPLTRIMTFTVKLVDARNEDEEPEIFEIPFTLIPD